MHQTPGRSDWHLRLLRPGGVRRVRRAFRNTAPGLLPGMRRGAFPKRPGRAIVASKKCAERPGQRVLLLSVRRPVAGRRRGRPLYFAPAVSGLFRGRLRRRFYRFRNLVWPDGEKTNSQPLMTSTYHQLLDATIQHLEDLKSRGVRSVAVSPETLRALAQSAAGKSQVTNFKSPASEAPASGPAQTELPKHAGSKTGVLQPAAEQASLLALPGETVPNQNSPLGSAGQIRRLRRTARARAGLREMPAPRVVAQKRRVRRRQH